jgi:hypothetical protein
MFQKFGFRRQRTAHSLKRMLKTAHDAISRVADCAVEIEK